MLPTQKNIIILTSGLTGSSVLSGLFAQSGYWCGDRTHKKEYNTYENAELIELNQKIFHESGYTGNYIREFSTDAIARIAFSACNIDLSPYQNFVERCSQHRPWVWKDPRLWLTIYFWKHLLNLDDCRILVLTRDPIQAWISGTLRRQIRSYGPFRRYEDSIRDSIVSFLNGNRIPYLHVRYEQLIAHPAETIQRLNAFAGSELRVEDLKAVYRRPLNRYPRASAVDHVKAALIYLKNYAERY